MKTRRLPDTDLAIFASLDEGEPLERALRAFKAGGGAWSYDPVKQSSGDILAAKAPLYEPAAPIAWSKIRRQISRACLKGAKQLESNVQVGKILYDSGQSMHWSAVSLPMGHLPTGVGGGVRYWHDIVIIADGQAIIPFFDFRRGRGVANPGIRKIVFSMQNIWVRDRHADLANARLAVFRFPTIGEERYLKIHLHDDGDLLSFEELDRRVRVVYETWSRICVERTASPGAPKTATPFGF
jgi:hypothetical protein